MLFRREVVKAVVASGKKVSGAHLRSLPGDVGRVISNWMSRNYF